MKALKVLLLHIPSVSIDFLESLGHVQFLISFFFSQLLFHSPFCCHSTHNTNILQIEPPCAITERDVLAHSQVKETFDDSSRETIWEIREKSHHDDCVSMGLEAHTQSLLIRSPSTWPQFVVDVIVPVDPSSWTCKCAHSSPLGWLEKRQHTAAQNRVHMKTEKATHKINEQEKSLAANFARNLNSYFRLCHFSPSLCRVWEPQQHWHWRSSDTRRAAAE